MEREVKDTICLTAKVLIPSELIPQLEAVYAQAVICVQEMIADRTKNSTKYYAGRLPATISNALLRKYQRNKKCKRVSNVVIPVCGSKGENIKIVDGGLRIPVLFKKAVIHIKLPRPIVGFIRCAEFFKRDKKWFMAYTYNTPVKQNAHDMVLGVDRNSRDNVATIAMPETGKVVRLGPDASNVKENFRDRRSKLQKKGKKVALKNIKRKQSRRIRDINHKVSRAIVDYAVEHRCAIVLEDLNGIRKGKAKRYADRSQWSFCQLGEFIQYKATLHGIPVFFVSAAYTSQKCSRCGTINKPDGKHYVCAECGHVDHRDANAAFNIAQRFLDQTVDERESTAGLIDEPLNWKAASGVPQFSQNPVSGTSNF